MYIGSRNIKQTNIRGFFLNALYIWPSLYLPGVSQISAPYWEAKKSFSMDGWILNINMPNKEYYSMDTSAYLKATRIF